MREKKIKPLIWNAMFEVVFDNQIEVVIAMINDCCGTSYQVGRDEIKINKRQIPRTSIKEMALTCDFIVEINKYSIYNIELNKRKYTGLGDRNWNYILKLHSSRIEVGCKYKDLGKYQAKQINLNQFRNDDDVAVGIEGWASYTARSAKYKNIGVFQFDIEYCYNLVYNSVMESVEKIPKLYRWGAIFHANSIEKIDYILGSDMLGMDMKKDLLKKIEDTSTNEFVLSKISLEEDFEGTLQDEIEIARAEAAKIGRKEGLEKGLKEGIEKGIEKGRVEGIKEGLMQGRQEKEEIIINTIKSMLDNQLDIELISKITNRSMKEILKIKESM